LNLGNNDLEELPDLTRWENIYLKLRKYPGGCQWKVNFCYEAKVKEFTWFWKFLWIYSTFL
jgi:hypothetical protein